MVVYFGADHGGFDLKERLEAFVKGMGYETADLGAATLDPNDDYPEFAEKVARKVSTDPENSRGILVCRSGAGIAIAANKIAGVRATPGVTPDEVFDARDHLNLNILSISGDSTLPEDAEKLVKVFLQTPFSGNERHVRRLKEIEKLEQHG